MSQTHLATPAAMASSCDRAVLAGVALSSFAALLLELALTRLFSVVLFYHFAFLAISIALLGLGAGGVCAYLAKTRLARLETRTLLARLSALNALLIPVVLEVVLHVPVSRKFIWLLQCRSSLQDCNSLSCLPASRNTFPVFMVQTLLEARWPALELF